MRLSSSPSSSRMTGFVLALALLTYAAGLLVPIMEPDAAAYAEIAREMVSRGDFFTFPTPWPIIWKSPLFLLGVRLAQYPPAA